MKESFADKVIQTENVDTARRFLTGALLALAIPFDWPALVAAGVASAALDTVASRMEKNVQQKALLGFYKNEIGALLGKDADSVTIDDLKKAAAPKEKGGLGISTLQKELDDYDLHDRFQTGFGVVTAAIMTVALVSLEFAFPQFLAGGMGLALGLGLAGLANNLISQLVKTGGQLIFGGHEHKIENGVHQKLMRIGHEIKQHPADPIEIFGLFAQCDENLAAAVKKQFGANYDDLTILQKKQALAAFEPQVHAVALTGEINAGTIKPGLAGFIISGNATPELPGYDRYQAILRTPQTPEAAKSQQEALEMFFSEREKQKAADKPTGRHVH